MNHFPKRENVRETKDDNAIYNKRHTKEKLPLFNASDIVLSYQRSLRIVDEEKRKQLQEELLSCITTFDINAEKVEKTKHKIVKAVHKQSFDEEDWCNGCDNNKVCCTCGH